MRHALLLATLLSLSSVSATADQAIFDVWAHEIHASTSSQMIVRSHERYYKLTVLTRDSTRYTDASGAPLKGLSARSWNRWHAVLLAATRRNGSGYPQRLLRIRGVVRSTINGEHWVVHAGSSIELRHTWLGRIEDLAGTDTGHHWQERHFVARTVPGEMIGRIELLPQSSERYHAMVELVESILVPGLRQRLYIPKAARPMDIGDGSPWSDERAERLLQLLLHNIGKQADINRIGQETYGARLVTAPSRVVVGNLGLAKHEAAHEFSGHWNIQTPDTPDSAGLESFLWQANWQGTRADRYEHWEKDGHDRRLVSSGPLWHFPANTRSTARYRSARLRINYVSLRNTLSTGLKTQALVDGSSSAYWIHADYLIHASPVGQPRQVIPIRLLALDPRFEVTGLSRDEALRFIQGISIALSAGEEVQVQLSGLAQAPGADADAPLYVNDQTVLTILSGPIRTQTTGSGSFLDSRVSGFSLLSHLRFGKASYGGAYIRAEHSWSLAYVNLMRYASPWGIDSLDGLSGHVLQRVQNMMLHQTVNPTEQRLTFRGTRKVGSVYLVTQATFGISSRMPVHLTLPLED